MKKFITFTLICLMAVIFLSAKNGQAVIGPYEKPAVYYVDRRLHKLIPIEQDIKGTTQKLANQIIKSILSGRNENTEILRLFPDNNRTLSVHVSKDTAYVDISEEIIPSLSKNPETERLMVYQIVNSLSTVPGIDKVRFTIGGKSQRDFLGFLNMQEIFTPDYDI